MEQSNHGGIATSIIAVAAGGCITLGALAGANLSKDKPDRAAFPAKEDAVEVTRQNTPDILDIPAISPAIEATILVQATTQPSPGTEKELLQSDNTVQAAPEEKMSQDHANWLATARASPHACVRDLANVASRTRLYFGAGQTGLSFEARAQALIVARLAKDCPQASISVVGFTDPSGDPDVNLQISWDRANSVLSMLRANGHPIDRFSAHSHNAVHGPDCKHYDVVDRRVEFEIFETPQEPG